MRRCGDAAMRRCGDAAIPRCGDAATPSRRRSSIFLYLDCVGRFSAAGKRGPQINPRYRARVRDETLGGPTTFIA
jgi:hypothetical protein